MPAAEDFQNAENVPKGYILRSRDRTWCHVDKSIVPVESTASVYFRKVIVMLSIVVTVD